jgi:hypothetical protein
VYLGGNSRENMREHQVFNFTAHPDYNQNTRANDIVIIRLTNPITPSAEVHPISLPVAYPPPHNEMPFEFEEIYVDGYGQTAPTNQLASTFLYRSYQRVTSHERCRGFFIVEANEAFCGEDREQRSNVCFGDLGAPVVGIYRRQPFLAGIVRMHPTCGVNQPAAYTRISHFNAWIQTQLV